MLCHDASEQYRFQTLNMIAFMFLMQRVVTAHAIHTNRMKQIPIWRVTSPYVRQMCGRQRIQMIASLFLLLINLIHGYILWTSNIWTHVKKDIKVRHVWIPWRLPRIIFYELVGPAWWITVQWHCLHLFLYYFSRTIMFINFNMKYVFAMS